MATATKERPIVFGPDDVRAILATGTLVTRRVARPPDDTFEEVVRVFDPDVRREFWRFSFSDGTATQCRDVDCPYGCVGDRLWVKETWARYRGFGQDVRPDAPVIYKADRDECGQYPCLLDGQVVLVNDREPWRRSIHMPRWASRITVELADVGVERSEAGGWNWVLTLRRVAEKGAARG